MMLFFSSCISLFCAMNFYVIGTGDAALLPSSSPQAKSPVVSLDVYNGDHHQHFWKRGRRKWKPLSPKEQLEATVRISFMFYFCHSLDFKGNEIEVEMCF